MFIAFARARAAGENETETGLLIAFARARAAGKNETETGHARAKAKADIALSLPEEYEDYKNDTRAGCIMHSAQPATERRWSNRRTNTHAARGL